MDGLLNRFFSVPMAIRFITGYVRHPEGIRIPAPVKSHCGPEWAFNRADNNVSRLQ